jgi:hypothetical protein
LLQQQLNVRNDLVRDFENYGFHIDELNVIRNLLLNIIEYDYSVQDIDENHMDQNL